MGKGIGIMIIKSHIRGGYRAAADYLKDIGANEKTRLVAISDPDAKNLDEAFHNMWVVACNTKCKKPLHHISINPFKDERLTDEQVLKIIERAEQKYGYKPCEHQRVIVEHIKDGRQHFHVMWNRVSLKTGKAVWPGEHWKKSKQVAREMEGELGLKRPTPKRFKRMFSKNVYAGVQYGRYGQYNQHRTYKGSRRYKARGSSGYNNGSRYSRTYRPKSSWQMSKVGGLTASHSLSLGRSGTASIGFNNRATFGTWSNGRIPSLSGIKSFVKLPPHNPAWQATSQNWIRPFRAGSSIRYWQPRGSSSTGSGSGGGSASDPYITAPYSALPKVNPLTTNQKSGRVGQPEQSNPAPFLPASTTGMSEAQRIDLEAAIAGKITWSEYFKKWGGGGGLTL